MSTGSILSSKPAGVAPLACPGCGAPLAVDQRYCLECGERQAPMSSVLVSGPPASAVEAGRPATPLRPPGMPPAGSSPQRNQTLNVIAGVGVLMLAMGVGVLIGRSSVPKQSPAPAQVITVAGGIPGGSTGSTATGEATFTGDWPAATKSGYTVQLQTLPETGTPVSSVEAAKASATGKGAKAVGALKSEEFSSLKSGSYVIYSGVYHERSEAQRALAPLKKSFPGASVIQVSNGSSASSSKSATSSAPGGSPSSSGSANLSHPASSKALESLKSAKGKSYAEKSKALPNVVEVN